MHPDSGYVTKHVTTPSLLYVGFRRASGAGLSVGRNAVFFFANPAFSGARNMLLLLRRILGLLGLPI